MDYDMNEGHWKYTEATIWYPREYPSSSASTFEATGMLSVWEFTAEWLDLTVKYECISFIVPYGLGYEWGALKLDRANKMVPPRIPLANHYLYMMQQTVYQYGTFKQ